MTQTIDTENNYPTESNHSVSQREVSTYKQKRIFWPFIGGACVLLLTAHPFIAFVAYIIFGLIYDCLVFKVDGCRDSEVIPSQQLSKEQITGDQYDNLNNFLIKIRQVAFALSVAAAAFSLLFFEAANYQFVFVATYLGLSAATIFWAVETDKIVYPHKETPNNGDDSAAFQRMLVNNPYNRIDDGVFDPCAPARLNPRRYD